MKILAISLITLSMGFMACQQEKSGGSSAKPVDLSNDSTKFSYALGLEIGGSIEKLGAEINMDAFVKGLNDTLNGVAALLTAEEALEIKRQYFQKLQQEKQAAAQKESNDYLAANKKKEGVITTESGLQYEVLQEGTGDAMPTLEDQVKVHYTGTFLDGKEFDSSYKRGQPTTFPVTGVIPGWTEALQLMKVGSKFRIVVPPNLGYGERGAGRTVPPNSTLVFEMELLEILPKEKG